MTREARAFCIVLGRVHDLVQHAVDAVAHAQSLLVGLDVDVRCAAAQRVGENQVDQLDDGSFAGRLAQGLEVDVLVCIDDLELARRIQLLGQVAHHLADLRVVLGSVEPVDGFLDGTLRGDQRLDTQSGGELEVVHGNDVGRIDHRYLEDLVVDQQRHHEIPPRHLGRHQIEQGRQHLDLVDVGRRNSVLVGEQTDKVGLVDQSLLDQVVAEPLAACHLVDQRLGKSILGDQPVVDKKAAEARREPAVWSLLGSDPRPTLRRQWRLLGDDLALGRDDALRTATRPRTGDRTGRGGARSTESPPCLVICHYAPLAILGIRAGTRSYIHLATPLARTTAPEAHMIPTPQCGPNAPRRQLWAVWKG